MSLLENKVMRSVLIPGVVAGLFVLVALTFSYADARSNEMRVVDVLAQRAAQVAGAELGNVVISAQLLTAFVGNSDTVTASEYLGFAQQIDQAADLIDGLALVDQNGKIQHLYGSYLSRNTHPDQRAVLMAGMARNAAAARWSGAPLFVFHDDPELGRRVMLLTPIFTDGRYRGVVTAEMHSETYKSVLLSSGVSEEDGFTLWLDGQELTSRAIESQDFGFLAANVVSRRPIAGLGGEWIVEVVHPSIESRAAALAFLLLGMLFLTLSAPLVLRAYQDRKRLLEYAAREREFVALVTHQLRQPLTQILWTTEEMLDEVPKRLRPDLETVRRIAVRAARFISDISSISRIERGVLKNTPVEISVDELLANILEPYGREIKQGRIETVVSNTISTLYIDEVKVAEAIRNIISNGLKYGEGTPVRVSASQQDDGSVVIRVSDSGPGIPPEAMPYIFEKAGSASKKLKSEGGAGVGLYLSKRFIELTGGQLRVASQPGETVFTILLPLAKT